MEPPETDSADSAIRLYEIVWEYYMYQATCITRDDYKMMQEKIGYPESFEEHQKHLLQGIPNDVSKMVNQIQKFLDQYIVFKDPKYAERIELLIEKLKSDPARHKEAAFQALLAQFKDRDPAASIPDEAPAHPPIFDITIGGMKIVLPTYGNPMMTALYSLLFVCFERFQAEEASFAASGSAPPE